MDKTDLTKLYPNGEVTVVWQPAKCWHSRNCVRNLPNVFQPAERPWVKVSNGTSDEIVETVHKCPSGALSIKEENNQPKSE